jgi:DNA helicase-2/ATP-dependent DNA helicase PcrA
MKEKFPNYDARREDLVTLQEYAAQFETAEDFLSQLALLGGLESPDAVANAEDTEKATLSTLHQAKGLEWRVVFLIWLADGMFPSSRSIEDPGALEEERRLFDVGVTRCMDELYLTYPEMRLAAGYDQTFHSPSRFLREVPESLFESWDVRPVASDKPIPLARQRRKSLLSPLRLVFCKEWGRISVEHQSMSPTIFYL